MTVRCCRCGRVIKASAVQVDGSAGPGAYGPSCALLIGLAKSPKKRRWTLNGGRRGPKRDPRQLQLLETNL